jgi:AmmeMemoRadiSam system protein B
MGQQSTRRAAVAGSWYPGDGRALREEVDAYLARAGSPPIDGVQAVVAPHAGLMYSGPVGAYAYRTVASGSYDVAVLAGPSHYVGFDGTSVWTGSGFETPYGIIPVDESLALEFARAPGIVDHPVAHAREHSLEMQLPFVGVVLAGVPIVALVMGFQSRDAIGALADALVDRLSGRRALIIASTDLSHFFDTATARELDARTIGHVERFDPGALLDEMERYPEHERGRFVGCGAGPLVAVMQAAKRLGAESSRVLRYADSGDVSGDRSSVVGYLAAAFGSFAAGAASKT